MIEAPKQIDGYYEYYADDIDRGAFLRTQLDALGDTEKINKIKNMSPGEVMGVLSQYYKNGEQWKDRDAIKSDISITYSALVQRAMQLSGYSISVDGGYGPLTRGVVLDLILDHKLPKSENEKGRAGPVVFGHLENMRTSKYTQGDAETFPYLDEGGIAGIQQELKTQKQDIIQAHKSDIHKHTIHHIDDLRQEIPQDFDQTDIPVLYGSVDGTGPHAGVDTLSAQKLTDDTVELVDPDRYIDVQTDRDSVIDDPKSLEESKEERLHNLRMRLESVGYGLRSSTMQEDEDGLVHEVGRTSLENVKKTTINGAYSFLEEIKKLSSTTKYPVENLMITGLSEPGPHVAGVEYSHAEGDKMDVRIGSARTYGVDGLNLVKLLGIKKGETVSYKIDLLSGSHQWLTIYYEPYREDENGDAHLPHLDFTFYAPDGEQPIGFREVGLDDIKRFQIEELSLDDQYPSIYNVLQERDSPITTRDIILAHEAVPEVPISRLMVIMQNDSGLGTTGEPERLALKNPGNVGGDDDPNAYPNRGEGVIGCAENIRNRMTAFSKKYPNRTPTLRQLVENRGPDGRGFFLDNIGKPNSNYEGAYMETRSAYKQVEEMVLDYEQNKDIPTFV